MTMTLFDPLPWWVGVLIKMQQLKLGVLAIEMDSQNHQIACNKNNGAKRVRHTPAAPAKNGACVDKQQCLPNTSDTHVPLPSNISFFFKVKNEMQHMHNMNFASKVGVVLSIETAHILCFSVQYLYPI
jgi:hypothetical protein